MPEKYASDFPLPGGVEQYFDTLLLFLRRIREAPCSHQVFASWIAESVPGSSHATPINYYISSISRMELWSSKENQIRLTPAGLELLDKAEKSLSDAKRTVVDLKIRLIEGYDVLLAYLVEGPRSLDEMHARLKQTLGVDWKTKQQTMFRVYWLRSLGCVEKQGKNHVLTEAGKALANGLKNSPSSAPSIPPQAAQPSPSRNQHTNLVAKATAIGDRMSKAAVQGGDGYAMEQATAEAFAFLGFDTQAIGGSGNPDIVASASMGERSYRVLVETKSRSGGVIQQNDVNFNALKEHKSKSDADYMIVVGAEFSGGNLEKWAKEHRVRLVRVDELREVLLAHSEAVIPLDSLEVLFQGGGPTDEAVLSRIMEESENTGRSMCLAREVYEAVRDHQDKQGILDAHSLFYVLHAQYPIEALETTISLLESDLVGALGRSEKKSLYAKLSPKSLRDKLAQLGRAMEPVALNEDS